MEIRRNAVIASLIPATHSNPLTLSTLLKNSADDNVNIRIHRECQCRIGTSQDPDGTTKGNKIRIKRLPTHE